MMPRGRIDARSKEVLTAEELEREASALQDRGQLPDMEGSAKLWLDAFAHWRRLVLTAPDSERHYLLGRAERAAQLARYICGQLERQCERALRGSTAA